jgi:multicomponent Na+:H+ antiporter subunit C
VSDAPNLVLVVLIGVLFGAGIYLLLERSLTRILIGITLLGNGANLLLLVAGGAAGGPPLIGSGPEEEMADPLPQAFVLTAIVITLGMSAFLLAMAYRAWQLGGHDEVQDDDEDRRLARRAARGVVPRSDVNDLDGSLAQEAAESRDETVHGTHASGIPAIRPDMPAPPGVSPVRGSDPRPGGAAPPPVRRSRHEVRGRDDDGEAHR